MDHAIEEEELEAFFEKTIAPEKSQFGCAFLPEKLFGETIKVKFGRYSTGVATASCEFNGQSFVGFGNTPCFALFAMLSLIIGEYSAISGFPKLTENMIELIKAAKCDDPLVFFDMVAETRIGTGRYPVVVEKVNGVYKASLGKMQ